jgi:hypothetical protein
MGLVVGVVGMGLVIVVVDMGLVVDVVVDGVIVITIGTGDKYVVVLVLMDVSVEPVSSNVAVLPPTTEDAVSGTFVCDSKLAVELVPF